MNRRSRRARLLGTLLGGLPLAAGCGEHSDAGAELTAGGRDVHATLLQQIRPTDGTGWQGNGYEADAMVKSYDPPGGHFRVFYALAGASAVDPTDADHDGVPDFVSQVGVSAEATYQSTIVQRGFRPPLDDSVYHDRPDYGGDGRFDIYLRLAGPGSDGYRVVEVCTDGRDGLAPDRCAGYFVMNPSFKGTTYKTELDGIQVLTSHELFHAIQDAYNNGQWRTFTEGTAVWNELQVFPRTPDRDGTWKDYLGFAPALFSQPERPIDQSMGTGPGGAYAYATAVWFEFLSERFGPQLIRELWEGSEAKTTGMPSQFLDVTASVLKARYETDLETTFAEFTRWNLLTAARAADAAPTVDQPAGYQGAAEYPAVRLETTITQIGERRTGELVGLSARYFALAVPLTAPQRLRLHLDDSGSPAAVGTLYVVPAGSQKPGPAIAVPGSALDLDVLPGQQLLLVATGAARGARSHTVSVYLDTDVAVPPPPPPPAAMGGCDLRGARAPAAWGWLWALLALGATGLRRRFVGCR